MNQEWKETFNEKETDLFKKGGEWVGGLFLILLGGIFLLNTTDIRPFGLNSWALFMLIPFYFILVGAWHQYRESGFGRALVFMIFFALFPFAYLFGPAIGIDLNLIWPLMLIVMGIGAIIANR